MTIVYDITIIVYSLRSQPVFQIARINTTLKGIESVRYYGPVIWKNIVIEMRSIKNFEQKSENESRQNFHVDYVKLM